MAFHPMSFILYKVHTTFEWTQNKNMEIRIPFVPPNYTDDDNNLVICELRVKKSEFVYKDQNLFDIDTNYAVLEVISPASGMIQSINIEVGQKVEAEMIAILIDPSAKEPFLKRALRVVNVEFLSGLMLGSLVTYVILKILKQ